MNLSSLHKNLILRIISGMILICVFSISILYYLPLFYFVICLIAIGMLVEYYQITKSSLLYLLFGFIVISIAIIALILTINQYNSKYLLLFYFINIWSTDTFAMIGGKLLKGPKLAVAISPNKTWSGLIIAIIGASIVSYFFTTSLNVANNLSEDYQLEGTDLILLSVIIAALGQISDLMISYVKRQFNVKDSGTIIAGHGGVLDRFDSIIITAPILLYCSGLLI